MPKKKPTQLELRRKRTLTASVKNMEKMEAKLELELKKLKKDLVVFRFFCS